MSTVTSTLIEITTKYYPDVIRIAKNIEELDDPNGVVPVGSSTPSETKLTDKNRAALLDMAYRVSIFSIVMDHIQQMEHVFVKSLEILRRNSHKK